MRLSKLFLIAAFLLLAIGIFCLIYDQVLASRAECESSLGECCSGCGPCFCTVCYSQVSLGVPLGSYGFTILSSGLAVFGLLSYAKFLKQMGWRLPDFKKVVAAMTLSGGSVYVDPSSYKYCVRYYGKDIVLHNIFCDLVKHAYGFKVKPAKWKTRGSFVTQIYRKELVRDLLSFSPSYTTQNNGGNDGHDPTAAFLLDSSYEVVREAVRLASSANGCVRYDVECKHNHGDRYFIRPQFCFGYLSTPALLNDYGEVLKRVGIETFPVFDRRFEMRGFLISRSWQTIKTFAKMNGFVGGVKIHFGNHRGLERNRLLRALLSFHRNEENRFETSEDAVENLQKCL